MLITVHGAQGVQGRTVIQRLLADDHQIRAITRTQIQSASLRRSYPFPLILTNAEALMRAYDDADGVVVVLPGGAAEPVTPCPSRRHFGSITARPCAAGDLQSRWGDLGDSARNPLPGRTDAPRARPAHRRAWCRHCRSCDDLQENFSEGWIVDHLPCHRRIAATRARRRLPGARGYARRRSGDR